jgi:hypothetical protein
MNNVLKKPKMTKSRDSVRPIVAPINPGLRPLMLSWILDQRIFISALHARRDRFDATNPNEHLLYGDSGITLDILLDPILNFGHHRRNFDVRVEDCGQYDGYFIPLAGATRALADLMPPWAVLAAFNAIDSIASTPISITPISFFLIRVFLRRPLMIP